VCLRIQGALQMTQVILWQHGGISLVLTFKILRILLTECSLFLIFLEQRFFAEAASTCWFRNGDSICFVFRRNWIITYYLLRFRFPMSKPTAVKKSSILVRFCYVIQRHNRKGVTRRGVIIMMGRVTQNGRNLIIFVNLASRQCYMLSIAGV
jgi:hypothetical protein